MMDKIVLTYSLQDTPDGQLQGDGLVFRHRVAGEKEAAPAVETEALQQAREDLSDLIARIPVEESPLFDLLEYYTADTLIDDLIEELREANERIAALEAANEELRVNVLPISEHVSENVLSNLRTEADLRAWVQHLIDDRGKSGWRNKSERDEPEGHPI